MFTRLKVLPGALGAVLMLAGAVSTASAGRLSVSGISFRQHWGLLTFSSAPAGGGTSITCEGFTMEGTFLNRTFAKVARTLIGTVTKAYIEHPCERGEVQVLSTVETGTNTLPWHLSYESFQGTLPAITGIRMLFNPAFVIEAGLSGVCLYTGNAQAVLRVVGGVGAGMAPDGTVAIGRSRGGFLCPAQIYLSQGTGVSSITNLSEEQAVTITLI